MKRVLVFLALVAFAGTALAGEAKLGKPLKVKQPTAISKLLEKPDQYVGKTVQVKGKITEVCQMMGCWIMIADDTGKAVKIKVKDGEIVFPKESAGKMAIAEGKFAKVDAAAEQAQAHANHGAEAQAGQTEAAKAKAQTISYQINGTGAVIVD